MEETFRNLTHAIPIARRAGWRVCQSDGSTLLSIHCSAVSVQTTKGGFSQLQTFAVTILKQVIFHLFVQSLHLGNNSMRQVPSNIDSNDDKNDQIITHNVADLGNGHEPYVYHEHLFLRGNPKHSYFVDAPVLEGPSLGVSFGAQDAKGKMVSSSTQIQSIVKGLKNVLSNVS